MRVKALQSMYYGRQMRAVGETYEMDDREESEAKILQALGKIQIIKTPSAAIHEAPKYEAAAFKAEPEGPAAPMTTESSDAITNRKVYRRRDMRAER